MREKVLWRLAAVVLAAFSASCVMVMNPEEVSDSIPNPEFRRTVEFQAGGTVSLDDLTGNVRITGWDNDSVEIVATAGTPGPGDRPSVQVGTPWDLDLGVDVKKNGDVLRIQTRSPEGPWASGGLDYSIRVPHSVNLDRIRVEKGDVNISDVYGRIGVDLSKGLLMVVNFSGPLRAAVGSGRVDAEFLDIRDTDVIDITVGEGDITVRLQPDANVRVEAESAHGEITSEYAMGAPLPARTLTGRLGNGAGRIILKALRGNIRILKTQ